MWIHNWKSTHRLGLLCGEAGNILLKGLIYGAQEAIWMMPCSERLSAQNWKTVSLDHSFKETLSRRLGSSNETWRKGRPVHQPEPAVHCRKWMSFVPAVTAASNSFSSYLWSWIWWSRLIGARRRLCGSSFFFLSGFPTFSYFESFLLFPLNDFNKGVTLSPQGETLQLPKGLKCSNISVRTTCSAWTPGSLVSIQALMFFPGQSRKTGKKKKKKFLTVTFPRLHVFYSSFTYASNDYVLMLSYFGDSQRHSDQLLPAQVLSSRPIHESQSLITPPVTHWR